MDATENFTTIKVNLDDEVRKLSIRDGMTDEAHLVQLVTMPRKDYYKASVVAHFHGYDEGYLAAFRSVSVVLRTAARRTVLALLVGVIVGATVPTIMLILC